MHLMLQHRLSRILLCSAGFEAVLLPSSGDPFKTGCFALFPGAGSPLLLKNTTQAHLPSGAHSALATMNYGGDGSGERAPLLSHRGAGKLGIPPFLS